MGNKSYKKIYEKYKSIPENREERLNYIFDKLNIKDKDINAINNIIEDIKQKRKKNKKKISMVFYIVPEGIARPRKGRNRFYVPNIQKFYDCMDDYLKQHKELKDLYINTECKIDLRYYLKIPSDMKKYEKILAELKVIRSIKKPDWDNLGKGSDMLHRIMSDDSIIVDARVRKFYSFKPRIEVTLFYYDVNCVEYYEKYLNKLMKKGDNK